MLIMWERRKQSALIQLPPVWELTLRLLGIGEGDEVITSAYTYTASASVVCHVGAKLKLIDTAPGSDQMDYEKLEEAVTEKTKAIIPVDLAGVICDYDRIFEIAEKKKALFHGNNDIQNAIGRVAIIADAAHAFGASRAETCADSLPILPAFPSMQSKISQQQREEP